MPNPTRENVHVNRPLTNIAVNYIQDQDKFIADQVFPYVPVDKKSDDYFKFDKNDLLRVEAKKRAAGAESAGSGYRVATDSYSTDVYAFHKDVADQIRANSDNPLAPDRNATQFVMQNLLMKREIIFGNSFMESGVWDNEDDSKDWSSGSGNPIDDIQTAKDTIEGLWDTPNVVVMGTQVYNRLRNHSDFLDRIKYTQEGVVSKELMARAIGVDKIVVGNAIYSDAEEGASFSGKFCIPKDACLIAYAPESPQIDLPSAGYTFGWEDLPGADGMNTSVRSFRIEERKSDRIEGEMAFDMKVVSSALGYLYYDITL